MRKRSRPKAIYATVALLALLGAGLPMSATAATVVPPVDTPSDPGTEPTLTDPAAPEGENQQRELQGDVPSDSEPGVGAFDEDAPIEALAAPGLNINVVIDYDGTAPFDADSAAGNDANGTNGVVRVNDTVNYGIQYNVVDAAATNVTWSITFPKGMEILDIPGYCSGPGSEITPATAGSPALPLTAGSFDELVEQTLTCNMGDFDASVSPVSNTAFVAAKVLNVTHQAQSLELVRASITADDVETPSEDSTLPSVVASARLKWDISKNGTALADDSGYNYGPTNTACPWDSTLVCKITAYPVLFSAPAGGKGAMPAVGDITFTDDLSPETLHPGLTPAQYAAINADLEKYGSRVVTPFGLDYAVPGGEIGKTAEYTPVNSVRDSGTITATQAGPGQPASIKITDADLSLRTYPTQAFIPAGTALPAGSAYAIQHAIAVYTPVAVIRDFGIESNSTWTLPSRNAYTELELKGFEETDVQTSSGQPQGNDFRSTSPTVSLPGLFGKVFTGVPGAPRNMTPLQFNPGSPDLGAGPPGGATARSGGITVAPTQEVLSQLQIGGSNTALPADVSVVACDAWDNTKLQLQAQDVPGYSPQSGATGAKQFVGSGGSAVWVSGYNNVSVKGFATAKSETPDIVVQYSATPGGPAAASECGAAQGPWFSSPEAVPGNDPTLAAQGIFTAVSRVRVHVVLPEPAISNVFTGRAVEAVVSIGLRVPDSGLPMGTILPNWASNKRVNFESATMAQVIADSGTWSQSSYNPATHVGAVGDRLTVADAQARIDKKVRKGTEGSFSEVQPQVTGGDTVQYQLAPSLTSGAATPGVFRDVWVEDCLPGSQAFDSASVTPTLVVVGSTPADAKRPACLAGETYIRWVLSDQEVNEMIEPIILTVEVLPTATNGVHNNRVVIWAEGDASTLAQRSDDAQIQIANPAGISLQKLALTPVTQVNRTEAGTTQLNRWSVTMGNTLPESQASVVSAPDIIDVLPKNGTDGTSFVGSFAFDSAVVTEGGPSVRILYTSAATVAFDPNHATNAPAGSTTWCDAPSGGAVVSGTGTCPTSTAQVTGLRVQRPDAFGSGEHISFEVSMLGRGNEAGDIYVNRTFARAAGLDFPVGPLLRSEVVIGSSIGDYTWWDLNRNGVQDSFNGTPEPAATGVPVTLTGIDDLGNPVSATTTTDASGKYLFDNLRASDAAGYTVTFGTPAGASGFTELKAEGASTDVDSDADPESGAAAPVVLFSDTAIRDVDAGFLADGNLVINKLLEGAGVAPFGGDDELTFDVVCTFLGEVIFEDTVVLSVNGGVAVTSDSMGPIPALSTCVITETRHGDADESAGPVSVTIPWDEAAQASGSVTASLTNYYSAGTIKVAKVLTGDAQRLGQVRDTLFTVAVTCEIDEVGEEGQIRTVIYSGDAQVRGGESVTILNETGDPILLPLGTHCYGNETNAGGATSAVVDHNSFDNAAVVTDGDPQALQTISVTATNTFRCTPTTCPPLAITGGMVAGGVLAIALLLISGGLFFVVVRRRRQDA